MKNFPLIWTSKQNSAKLLSKRVLKNTAEELGRETLNLSIWPYSEPKIIKFYHLTEVILLSKFYCVKLEIFMKFIVPFFWIYPNLWSGYNPQNKLVYILYFGTLLNHWWVYHISIPLHFLEALKSWYHIDLNQEWLKFYFHQLSWEFHL